MLRLFRMADWLGPRLLILTTMRQCCDTAGPDSRCYVGRQLEHETFSNGTLYNQKFNPAALAGDEGLKRLPQRQTYR